MSNYIIIIGIVVATIIGAIGQIVFKRASKDLKKSIKFLINPYLITGVILYFLSTALLIFLLQFEKLTILYPLTSLNYIWVLILANRVFKEKINKYKSGGIILIILGIILIL